MAKFEFQGMLYRNSREVSAAIAAEWITGGGSNSDSEVSQHLAENADDRLADEAISGWGLNETVASDDDAPETWMESRGLTRGDIVAAFAAFRDTRATERGLSLSVLASLDREARRNEIHAMGGVGVLAAALFLYRDLAIAKSDNLREVCLRRAKEALRHPRKTSPYKGRQEAEAAAWRKLADIIRD